MRSRLSSLAVVLGLLAPAVFATRPPYAAAESSSLLRIGQPRHYRIELGASGGYGFRSEKPAARFLVDLEGRVALPQLGLLDVAFEGSLLQRGDATHPTFGASLKLPILRYGFEYDTRERDGFIKLTMEGAPRRGGILGRGDRLRLDYIPAKRTLELGVKMPLPWSGYRATRPRNAHVSMPRGSIRDAEPVPTNRMPAETIERLRHAMTWMDRLLTPNLTERSPETAKGRRSFERAAAALNEHARLPGHSFASEESVYHDALQTGFAAAGGGDEISGERLASLARSILLHDVIIPYNRRLGRIKRPGDLTGLAAVAQSNFRTELERGDLALDTTGRDAAAALFRVVLEEVDRASRAARKRWHTWRLVWVPLNYGLRPEEFDTQPELNAIVGEVIGHPFSSANRVRYSLNEGFYDELLRSVLETERYHLLWIHDYTGRNDSKGPDRVAWGFAIDGYVDAFIKAIRELDRGERSDLPQFYILLDEHYYRSNGSEPLMSVLEHLDRASAPSLSDKGLEARVRGGLERLRAAISGSSALKRLGPGFVARNVRVHVAITHPYDPTFMDDSVMRDHTKLAMRDVFEESPASGEVLLTGVGVGEHYVGPFWEDRSLVLQGTEAVRIKDAVRELLIGQGLRPNEIPEVFRARPFPPSFESTCDSLRGAGWAASVLTAANGTGFRDKHASVLKAAIYNLMRPGSILVAPDSLWASDFWGAMFVSAALRGCHAVPIAPASDHAPSSALPTLGLMHRTLWVLVRCSTLLEESIAAAGGSIHVGLYTKEDDVQDVRALLDRMIEKEWRGTPFRAWIERRPEILQELRSARARLDSIYPGPAHPFPTASVHKPHMHLKAQCFLNAEAVQALGNADWRHAIREYLDVRRRQSAAEPGSADALSSALTESSVGSLGGAWDRMIVISTLGSHNQDRRSLLIDGEILSATTGPACLPAVIDFVLLTGAATWPATAKELDAYFPETSSLWRKLSRWLRDLI